MSTPACPELDLADAFGMLAAALVLDLEPWQVRDPKPTPLCIAFGDDVVLWPLRVAPGSWLAGWTGVSWASAAAMPGLACEGADARRLDAFTLGALARLRWDAARAKEHSPHRFKATPVPDRYRCRCGAWARLDRSSKPPKLVKCGKRRARDLDHKLAQARDPDVPINLSREPLWGTRNGHDERGAWQASKSQTTPRVDQVMRGERRVP